MGTEEDDAIRDAAGSLVDAIEAGDEANREAGLKSLLPVRHNVLYPAAVIGIRKAIADFAPNNLDALTVLADFFVDKLMGEEPTKFLRALAEAKNPRGLCTRSAYNFTVDELRKLAPTDSELHENTEDAEAQTRDEVVDELQRISQAQQRLSAAIDSLRMRERQLMYIYFTEWWDMPKPVCEALAEYRAVAVVQVEAELETRRESLHARRSEAGVVIEGYDTALLRLHRRHTKVLHLVHALDGSPASATAKPEWYRSGQERKLNAATPGERSAVLVFLESEMSTKARKNDALKAENRDMPRRPGYEEVSWIWGVLAKEATLDERKRVIDKVTTRIRRLLKRLSARRSQ